MKTEVIIAVVVLACCAALVDAVAYAGEIACRNRWARSGVAFEYRGIAQGCMVQLKTGEWVDGDERRAARSRRVSSGRVTS